YSQRVRSPKMSNNKGALHKPNRNSRKELERETPERGGISKQLLSSDDIEGDTKCGTSGPPMDPAPAAAAALWKVSSNAPPGTDGPPTSKPARVGVPTPPTKTSSPTELPSPDTPCASGRDPT
ncbi:hypothetical protein A2U01_0057870, partial [Trifolium medium]|nr:hypothetical protein [Trifolium medium]